MFDELRTAEAYIVVICGCQWLNVLYTTLPVYSRLQMLIPIRRAPETSGAVYYITD